jgi:hypothetical protein
MKTILIFIIGLFIGFKISIKNEFISKYPIKIKGYKCHRNSIKADAG